MRRWHRWHQTRRFRGGVPTRPLQDADGAEIQLRRHADPLVDHAHSKPSVDVVGIELRREDVDDVAPHRSLQAGQAVSIASDDRDFVDRGLASLELFDDLVEPIDHAGVGVAEGVEVSG